MLLRLRHPLPLLLLIAALAACSANEPFDPASWTNTPPVASVWVLRADPDSLAPTTYNHATFHWSAVDIDGFVAGFHVSITEDGGDPLDWIFTTQEETTATYVTDENGRAAPTLYVVAEDQAGALSDTVSVTFPLFNFPPFVDFNDDFQPAKESIGSASFEYFGFDIDGDDTLLPFIDYRFEGSDPDLVFEIDDPLADPSLGWVRLDKNPSRFSLLLRDVPAGDPTKDYEQTIYVRILDEAGGVGEHSHSWKVIEALGDVLLIDDALNTAALASRDSFYRNSLDVLMPQAHTVWDISDGLPARDSDVWLTISQFRLLIWYTGSAESNNLLRMQGMLTDFITQDLDPDTPGVQSGQLLLETQFIASPARLGPTFVGEVIGVEKTPDPRSSFRVTPQTLAALQGKVDLEPQAVGLPLISSAGQNYLGGAGFFFNLLGLVTKPGTGELYRFEPYTYTIGARIDEIPLVAVRRPDTGVATTVTLGFQLEYCNALGNATEVLGIILRDHLGRSVQMPSGSER